MSSNDSETLDERISNLDFAELLDKIGSNVEASKAITTGSGDGLVHSLSNGPDGLLPDGSGMYREGQDRRTAINRGKTVVNQTVIVNKERATEAPVKFNVLVDWGNRYYGSTGLVSLANLARLTVATACIAAEKSQGTNLELTIVGKTVEPELLDRGQNNRNPIAKMEAYDEFVNQRTKFKKGETPSTLAEGIDSLFAQQLAHSRSVCLVISDFILGQEVDNDDHITGFDWEEGISRLANNYGDRLFVTRLTTPSQIYLPYTPTYTDGRRIYSVDTADYLAAAHDYMIRGQAQAEKIADILAGFRVLELSSTDETPDSTISDFMFGKPYGI